MALNSINTNIAAFNAQSNIMKANNDSANSISRLSSGERIAKASDDVSALSVGTSLRTQVTSLRAALSNTTQGISMLQVADGALSEVQDMLQRMKAIAVQATSGSLTTTERGFLDQEFQNLSAEIDRLVNGTNFNGVELINGGLGQEFNLLTTNAAGFDPTGANLQGTAPTAIATTSSIQAFLDTNATAEGTATAGFVQFVEADGTTAITGTAADFLDVNQGVYGSFSNFELSDIVYGNTAKITATINGVEFSGSFADNATTALVTNGNTRMILSFTGLNIADAGEVSSTLAQMYEDFDGVTIQRTGMIEGVDFAGTALEGAVGTVANGGLAAIRTSNPGSVDISNFQYVSNGGAANTSTITVQVNGETFTASTVNDQITGGIIGFQGSNSQALILDFNGLNANITNIRTSETDRAAFINALNIGFSRAGGGVEFNVGSTSKDNIAISLGDATTGSLFNGQNINVTTIADAKDASDILDSAIDKVTALRADVGALQSRFEFAAANVESSLQNQDAARGQLLDTDIATESTKFATAQVQLQAGISTLAQANLLPQNLLKLIG